MNCTLTVAMGETETKFGNPSRRSPVCSVPQHLESLECGSQDQWNKPAARCILAVIWKSSYLRQQVKCNSSAAERIESKICL